MHLYKSIYRINELNCLYNGTNLSPTLYLVLVWLTIRGTARVQRVTSRYHVTNGKTIFRDETHFQPKQATANAALSVLQGRGFSLTVQVGLDWPLKMREGQEKSQGGCAVTPREGQLQYDATLSSPSRIIDPQRRQRP